MIQTFYLVICSSNYFNVITKTENKMKGSKKLETTNCLRNSKVLEGISVCPSSFNLSINHNTPTKGADGIEVENLFSTARR